MHACKISKFQPITHSLRKDTTPQTDAPPYGAAKSCLVNLSQPLEGVGNRHAENNQKFPTKEPKISTGMYVYEALKCPVNSNRYHYNCTNSRYLFDLTGHSNTPHTCTTMEIFDSNRKSMVISNVPDHH
ncbi:hypothetical protein VNO77_33358 [Canavalia gladiata]|uniref:Uncharacterized protein n=1 Tax=Canavalia gladiata TaxID=3824 RepID=A0AAN9KBM4_CANGL